MGEERCLLYVGRKRGGRCRRSIFGFLLLFYFCISTRSDEKNLREGRKIRENIR